MFIVLHYNKSVNMQRALAGHGEYSPLDSLMRGGNHSRSDDGWDWRQ